MAVRPLLFCDQLFDDDDGIVKADTRHLPTELRNLDFGFSGQAIIGFEMIGVERIDDVLPLST